MQKFSRRDALKALVGASLYGIAPKTLVAQGSWPNRPLRMIVPFPSGGTADVLARLMAQRLADAIGQPIVLGYARTVGERHNG